MKLFNICFTVYSNGGSIVESNMSNAMTQVTAIDWNTARSMVEAQYGGWDRKVIVHSVDQV